MALALPLVLAVGAFVGPVSRVAVAPSARAASPVALGDFKLPEIPNPFGGLLEGFGGGDDFRLFPDDVQFSDVDGDLVTLRGKGATVDLYVGKKAADEQLQDGAQREHSRDHGQDF